jgi:hypothetical protein
MMQELFHHGFECGGQQPATLHLVCQTKLSFAMKDEYKCGCYGKDFVFTKSSYTPTKAVAPRTKYSKNQPIINLLISKLAKMFGIGYKKLWKLSARVGMQCPMKSCPLSLGWNMQNPIKELGKLCLYENWKEHNQLACAQPNYQAGLVI